MIDALRKTFKNSKFGKATMAAALAVPLTLASFGPAASDAHAGEAQAATPGERGLDGVQGMRDMRHYSEDPATRGIGVFINLQENAPVTGDQIGQWIKTQFAGVGVPVEYRVNQSRGTATDITFYVRDIDFTVNVAELQTRLQEIHTHHQGAWLPEKTASLIPANN